MIDTPEVLSTWYPHNLKLEDAYRPEVARVVISTIASLHADDFEAMWALVVVNAKMDQSSD